MPELNSVIHDLKCCIWKEIPGNCKKCSYHIAYCNKKDAYQLKVDAIELLEKQKWYGADKRPPHEGYYLVYGLTEYVPDHYDLPNAYWEIKIGYWNDRYGWMTGKVKYWQELPELPKEGESD